MNPEQSAGLILLADDDAMIRLLAGESLRHAGFVVSEAADGETALRLFAEHPFDLILLDVLMPGIDGYAVCRQLRHDECGRWLPILLLTGLNDTLSIEEAYRSGATDFITKPVNWMLLTHRVRYALRASQAAQAVRRSAQRLAHAQRLARMGSWEWSPDEARLSYSDEIPLLFGDDWPLAGAATLDLLLQRVRESDRTHLAAARHALLSDGQPYQTTYGIRRHDGKMCEVFEQAQAIRDTAGRIIRIEGCTQDISERVEAQQRIEHLALHDSLTGLANRKFFSRLAAVELERAKRKGSTCAILHIDLDRFKTVNDALGEATGDRLLCVVAERLQASVRSTDLLALQPPMRTAEQVARIDGDSFTVLVLEITSPEQAVVVAQRLQQVVAQPLAVDGREVVLTASIGIALFPRDAASVDALSRGAEQALFAARASGPASCCFVDEQMNSAARARLLLESDLRLAISGNQLRLYFQPKVDATSGRVCGGEALVRWQHPRRGLLGPNHFIALAEETGLIIAIGDWVLAHTARHLQQWTQAGSPAVPISVNLASPSFLQDDVAEKCAALVREAGIAPQQIVLELTESLLMADPEGTIARLERVRTQGFALSLDDFGTGFSSLSYLKRFPLDELKIDRAFVRDVTKGGKDAAIALSIIQLAHQFGMRVVAEGVENNDQARFLLAHHCPVQQGFFYSPPVPEDDFVALLSANTCLQGHH